MTSITTLHIGDHVELRAGSDARARGMRFGTIIGFANDGRVQLQHVLGGVLAVPKRDIDHVEIPANRQ